MNTLSWLIYLADVADEMDWVLSLVSFICIIGFFICLIGYRAEKSSPAQNNHEALLDTVKSLMRHFLIAGIGFAFLSGVVPSHRTVMFIAASEFGEQIAETSVSNKAYQALDKYLSEYLSDD